MKLDSLQKLFLHELGDMLSAEKQIAKALPKIIDKATAPELKSALQEHLDVTEVQVSKLEDVYKAIGHSPRSIRCKGMEGILEEGNETLEEAENPDVIDAAIIASAQKVEHYEITTYGTLCAWGKVLGETQACEILEELLDEEKEADQKLSDIAESLVNESAVEESEEVEEEVGARAASTRRA